MSFTSDELNFLIYRYLQESGFQHSAFTFGHESLVVNSNINGTEVPPGALISFLQKGLQYKEIEAHLGENGQEVNCDEPFNLLTPHICQMKKKAAREPISQPRKDEMEVSVDIPESQVTVLEGHISEVFICAWNPKNSNLLASGSGDSTARIWSLESNTGPIELKHFTSGQEKSKEVTTLDWNVCQFLIFFLSHIEDQVRWNTIGNWIL